jgi:invasion protein IalB
MYDDEDDDPMPRRRRSLVPILATIAIVLAVAVGVAVVLFALGFFDKAPQQASTSADRVPSVQTQQQTQTPPPAASEPAAMPPQTDVPKASVSVAPPTEGEPPIKSVHGDWQVRCGTPMGAQGEQCVEMQIVTAEDRDDVGLTVIVLKTADKKARILRVIAPLGVSLQYGLGLKVDSTEKGRTGFVRCVPGGCVAEVILDDELLNLFRNGKTATFIIFQSPEEGIGVPISLNGFGEGYDALP